MRNFSNKYAVAGTSALRHNFDDRTTSRGSLPRNVVAFPGATNCAAVAPVSKLSDTCEEPIPFLSREALSKTEQRKPAKNGLGEYVSCFAETAEMIVTALRNGTCAGSYAQDFSRVEARLWAVLIAAIVLGIALV